MVASSKCPYPDCGHCFDLTQTGSPSITLCPQCRRPVPGPSHPGAALTLDLPPAERAGPPAPAETLALTAGNTSPEGPAQAVTLDLSGATPPLPPPCADTLDAEGRFERLGRFTIIRFLGEGGFGRVYEAHDPQLDRRIALKVARPERLADERSVELFLREARAAANLRHPHIVAVFDSGKDGQHYFIASAFIEGKSLDKRLAELAQGQTLPFHKSVTIVRQLGEALAYAHRRGVVHRDVKPANVMIDEEGQPLLMDFGLAARRVEGEAIADERHSMGTPAYMAPEQGRGDAEAASDQYSLGCTLYELLTGRTPFGGPAGIQVFLHQTQSPSKLRQVNPVVPLDLEAICLRCLHKEPGQRYANCQELADDLRRWLDREPVRARRVGLVERSVKWARRKPFQAISAASCMLLLILFLFAGWREARDYRLKYERKLQSEAYRSERETDYLDARQWMAQSKWVEAGRKLEGIQKGLEAMADLDAGDLPQRVKESLAEVNEQIQKDDQRKQALARFEAFQVPYRDAVFAQVPLTGRRSRGDLARTRVAAQKALAIYGLDVDSAPPARLVDQLEHDGPLLKADFARLTSDCYELLVIWADVEANYQQDPREPKASARQRGTKALALLERAAALGRAYKLWTQTYHIRKARYRAMAREETDPPVRADLDAPSEPTGALDWFFSGLESYQQAEQIEEAGRPDKYREASHALQQAVQLQSDRFWAHYLQGLCQLRLRHWGEARSALTICMNLQRDFHWPLVLRGFAANEQADQFRIQAEQSLKRAIQQGRLLHDGETIFRLLRQMESAFALARADLDQALAKKQLDPQARYVGLVNRGVLFIYQRQWRRAIADLEQAIRESPAAYQAHVNLAQAFRATGHHKEAMAAISRAIDRAPDLPDLYLLRAQMHLAQKRRAAALADFKRAIAREPVKHRSRQLAETLVKVGKFLLEEKEYPGALVQFERALKVRPDLFLTERFRAEALLHLKRNDEAAAALDRYLALTPAPLPDALQARGLLYAQKGGADRLRIAINLYTTALRLNVRDTKTRGYRGWAYLESGANRLALEDFEVCLREQPASTEYLTGRAAAHVRLRQVSEAVADAQAAENEGRLTDRLRYHLSCVYALAAVQTALETGTGRNRQAEQRIARYENRALLHLNRVLEEQPAQERARFWRDRVEKDPTLSGIRGGRMYAQMAKKYGLARR
jgi:tetratricopeptide (TPR) repeat protein/tRNA A-37 threonylcarbamoyl transferase component Bud32